jgi:hypothetical protein
MIVPWYTPTEALTAGTTNELNVGCADEDDLMFEWRPDSKEDLFYIKIFVTKERTSFSFLTQYGNADEDKLRGLTHFLK